MFLYGGFLIWLGYIAVTRWNGGPASVRFAELGDRPLSTPLDPVLDRTSEILAALDAVQPAPPWTLPPPPKGMYWPMQPEWPLDPADAVNGAWTPKTRPHLQAVIQYLETPAVQEAVAQLAAIKPGVCNLTWDLNRDSKYVPDLLCARARYHHAGQHDLDAAGDDLDILARFGALGMTSPNWFGLACGRSAERKAETEISRMVFENHLTRAQAARLIAILGSNLPDDRALWQRYVDSVISMHLVDLEHSYTIDDAGDGWLTLSRIDSLNGEDRDHPRFGLWNSLSPLFNSRRTVAAKIAWVRQRLEAVDERSSPEALRELALLDQHIPFNVLDGPNLREWARSSYLRFREVFTNQIALRRATIAGIALSTFRREHGEYPTSLESLVGEYLDAVPLDPYSDEPLRYVRKAAEDDYVLYSVGMSLVDDGGRRKNGDGMLGDDVLLGHERPQKPLREKRPKKVSR